MLVQLDALEHALVKLRVFAVGPPGFWAAGHLGCEENLTAWHARAFDGSSYLVLDRVAVCERGIQPSTAALETFVAPQAFNALKAALITYGSQLSQALAAQNIRVNCISPGAIYYPGGNWEMIQSAVPALYEATLAKMPMGRFGEPEEVAKAIVFVASPACPYMTGANIVIDGGFTQRVQF